MKRCVERAGVWNEEVCGVRAGVWTEVKSLMKHQETTKGCGLICILFGVDQRNMTEKNSEK